MQHKQIPRINGTVIVNFKTKLPPYSGNVSINPKAGVLGSKFNASISNWKTDNKLKNGKTAITWRIWTTKTLQGKIKDSLITKEWIPASQSVQFVASSVNPYLFEVRDSSLEIAMMTFFPNFTAPVVAPTQLMEIL